jgi:hypothetical protein
MLEQIVRGALWFMVATYVLATCKSLILATGTSGFGSGYVMVTEADRKPLIYPTIIGSDIPIPLSVPTPVLSRVVGASKLYYAVYPGVPVQDTRYRSFWR